MRLGALVAIFGEVVTRLDKRRLQRTQEPQEPPAKKSAPESGESLRRKPSGDR